eukprot:g26496.t1
MSEASVTATSRRGLSHVDAQASRLAENKKIDQEAFIESSWYQSAAMQFLNEQIQHMHLQTSNSFSVVSNPEPRLTSKLLLSKSGAMPSYNDKRAIENKGLLGLSRLGSQAESLPAILLLPTGKTLHQQPLALRTGYKGKNTPDWSGIKRLKSLLIALETREQQVSSYVSFVTGSLPHPSKDSMNFAVARTNALIQHLGRSYATAFASIPDSEETNLEFHIRLRSSYQRSHSTLRKKLRHSFRIYTRLGRDQSRVSHPSTPRIKSCQYFLCLQLRAMYISASAHSVCLTGAPVRPMLYASHTTLCVAAALTCWNHWPVCSLRTNTYAAPASPQPLSAPFPLIPVAQRSSCQAPTTNNSGRTSAARSQHMLRLDVLMLMEVVHLQAWIESSIMTRQAGPRHKHHWTETESKTFAESLITRMLN